MIRIRYRDFSYGTHKSPGLYGIAKRGRRGVTVYLLPGLAGSQRRAVFRRLRREASRGCGPELPTSQLAFAIGVDRVRVASRHLTAAIRLHPAGIVLPALAVIAAMALFVLVSAAGQFSPPPPGGLGGAAAVADQQALSTYGLVTQPVTVAIGVGVHAPLAGNTRHGRTR